MPVSKAQQTHRDERRRIREAEAARWETEEGARQKALKDRKEQERLHRLRQGREALRWKKNYDVVVKAWGLRQGTTPTEFAEAVSDRAMLRLLEALQRVEGRTTLLVDAPPGIKPLFVVPMQQREDSTNLSILQAS